MKAMELINATPTELIHEIQAKERELADFKRRISHEANEAILSLVQFDGKTESDHKDKEYALSRLRRIRQDCRPPE